MRTRFLLRASALLAACIVPAFPAAAQADKPVPIRLGTTTTSGEDQIWLMKARPDLTPNQGRLYTLETLQFRGGDLRFKAFQAGQTDGGVGTGVGVLQAAVKGVPLVAIAAISEENNAVYSSPYVVLEESDIKTTKDLRSRTLGLNGLRESYELGARLALLDAGLNPDRDVKWTVIPLVSMGEALRARKIDLAGISQPYFANEVARGGVRTLFTVHDAMKFKEEFMVYLNPDFLRQHREAVRAFLSDFVAATHFYINNTLEARQSILKAKVFETEPDLYLHMPALKRKADGKPEIEYLKQLQEGLLRAGFIGNRIDVSTMVDLSLFPGS
jgi:ABC-type nitrate/sulfonate/bicarbonate transport system substrate-binding protein